MSILGTALVVLSAIAMFVFGVQILIMAFKTSVGWGLASLFIPFAILVFVFKHWEQTKKPFLYTLACLPVYLIGFGLMFAGTLMGGGTSTP
jgi:hypothetical protein